MARALYIHWPFCLRKCPYCDFNSHVRGDVNHAAWEHALVQDMEHEAQLAGGGPLESVFFGGGTPSLMPPALVDTLLKRAAELWGFSDNVEITLEANPSSVEAANFADLSRAGINRVSLGLQALEDDALRFLGRLHSVEEGLAALDTAQRQFRRVSFDLIYARPHQSEQAWHDELARALSFGTDHLSLYQLTIEPNTRFATDVRKGAFIPLADDPAADLFDITRELTENAGIPAYEISNHARPQQESRHNLTYWRYHDYCGIGPGAHGRRNAHATLRHRKPENWLQAVAEQGHGLRSETALNPSQQASEALLMGLRLNEGVSLADFSNRFGLDFAEMIDQDRLTMLRDLGFIWQNNEGLGVTPRGMPVLDALLGDLIHTRLVTS